ITTPTREDLARVDRKRKKKGHNEEWVNPHDPDARITKMADGRTRLAHKAEHAVDMETGAVVAVTLQAADLGDTTTVKETLVEAGTIVADLIEREAEAQPLEKPHVNLGGIEEVVADKGYHSGPLLPQMHAADVRTYIPEKKQVGKRHGVGKEDQRYWCTRTGDGYRGRRGSDCCGGVANWSSGPSRTVTRPAACDEPICENTTTLKRLLIHVAGMNLGLLLRNLYGSEDREACKGSRLR